MLLVCVLLVSLIAVAQVQASCFSCASDYLKDLQKADDNDEICTAMKTFFGCYDKEDCPKNEEIKAAREKASELGCGASAVAVQASVILASMAFLKFFNIF